MRCPIPAISREETQAEEERLSKARHFEPVVIPTQKKYLHIANLWRESAITLIVKSYEINNTQIL